MNIFLRKLFLKNWGLKLFSLLFALILWITLIPPEKMFSEKNLTISLYAQNIPQDMELVEKPPAKIDVTIRAPNRYIDQITSENVVAELDMENASLFQEDYTLNKSMISMPGGIRATVVKITPNTINLKLERSVEIMLEVVPDTIGEPIEGLKIEKIEVDPAQVLIRGAESKIKKDYRVRTSPIDISTLMQTTKLEADLILPSPDLSFATSLTKVKVTIYIVEEDPGKTPGQKKRQRK
ncbi:MAG: CdaR family protein [Candidatus Aminicenantes bacterium]|jgi:YbbR domain-containing protein